LPLSVAAVRNCNFNLIDTVGENCMIKLNLFITRRPDLTFEQFAEYWTNVHWPKIKNETGATAVAFRYAQQHRIEGVPPGVSEAPFDGIVEGWWPDLPTLYSVLGSPEWTAITSDEACFLDRTKTLMLLTEEKVDWHAARNVAGELCRESSGDGSR
jgi:uncharacterized protein (TIGR02118 family)